MKNKIIHGNLLIWNFSSCVHFDIALACCPHLLAVELNTLRDIPYLCTPMYCSLCVLLASFNINLQKH